MNQKRILIFIGISISLVFLYLYFFKIGFDEKKMIINTLNTELNNLPDNVNNLEISKGYFFNNDNLYINFNSSKSEIDNWISRNKKNIRANDIEKGIPHYVIFNNNHYYFVVITNNNVEINFNLK